METKLKKHEVYKVNTEEVDFSDFRVLLVYANSPMDNLFAVGLSSIAGMLKKHNIDYEIFDTTYYPNDGRLGVNKKHMLPVQSKSHHEIMAERLQVAEFDYGLVGIKYIETNVYDDFRKKVEGISFSLILSNNPNSRFKIFLNLNSNTLLFTCSKFISTSLFILPSRQP